ncbi:hypothetical protein GCM10011512_08840 [Tersicoccus solisilvae]|uniref:DEAD/DEAH box helicase n=1 Tax=Tersicoccus solisilvae TaxID=1882339 RepID=A0ABQ1NSM6_9MICC|nr:type I restriction enzyme endonuclease domain-containing protein [Tersicoccus solisilvae]GGC84249.1 hypothetical protein GCM10011512_08840 [Tersicoccus solisilvae]
MPVSFEPRLIKVQLAAGVDEETLVAAADEATLGLDVTERSRMEQSVAVLNAVYGAPERITALAADLVAHWEARREAMRPFIEVPGKAMIVGVTREVCARLYAEIVKLRPEWHSDELDRGVIKVVYSGDATDLPPVSAHVRRDSENATIKQRLKDPDDELELVIVKDMMLTGYDSPPLHTLYLDRPLKGALLMQTLARVNRTFRGKSDGLLVAYAPLAENPSKALAEYTPTDRENKPVGRNVDEAVALATTLVGQIRALLVGHDWQSAAARGGLKGYIDALLGAVNYLRSPETPGNQVSKSADSLAVRFRSLSGQLSRAWALACGRETLASLLGEIRACEQMRVWMAKFDAQERQDSGQPVPADIQRMLAGLIDTATATGDVLDIYAAAGLPKPSLDDLTPEFFQKAQQAKNPSLAIEALRKLVSEESARTTRNNTIRQRLFSERITELMTKYTNQQLTSAEVISEMLELAQELVKELAQELVKEADRGKQFTPPLSSDELTFYDAVSQNDSAVSVQGEGVLADIARELVAVMRRDVRTDWTVRDDVRAKLRSSIKRLLAKHDYPPDKAPEAIVLVMEQMESMAARYVA